MSLTGPRLPELDGRERRLLLLLGAASFFNQYDAQLFSLLLVQIQADLAIPEASLGFLGSLARLGALPAFFVMLVADRFGRRSVLLFTITGYTTFTAATALAPDYASFVAFQFLAAMFLAAEFMLALVVIVEEFRPRNRGWGVGLLGMLAVVGRGFAMVGFGLLEHVPFGWRGLYALGVLPLLLLLWFRRGLPETRRFERVSQALPDEGALLGSLRPVVSLVRAYPRRFVAVAALGFLWSFSNGPIDFFLPKYLQEIHAWTPAEFARLALFGGALGTTGLLVGGWLSDRYSRKYALVAFLLLEPVLAIALYTVGVQVLFAVYVGWVFASVSNDTIGRTYSNELFSTSHRSTSAGARAIVATLGGVLGLAGESVLYAATGGHWTPVRVLAATGLVMPLIVLAALPETSGRALEEVSPDPVTS